MSRWSLLLSRGSLQCWTNEGRDPQLSLRSLPHLAGRQGLSRAPCLSLRYMSRLGDKKTTTRVFQESRTFCPQKQRSAPVRSQSMGMADTGRFYMKGMNGMTGPPPRFRPPPPPDERRPMVQRRVDYNETSSEGEEGPWEPPLVPDYRSWDRRKTQQQQYAVPHPQKYKTLEPRSRSGGDAQSLERLNSNRRVLPELPREQFPSHSLPRPGSKRAQSHSVARPEQNRPQEARRSQSHGDGLAIAEGRRKLPNVPGKTKDRDLREPTPDYDTSPPPSETSRLTGRRNSDSGILNAPAANQVDLTND